MQLTTSLHTLPLAAMIPPSGLTCTQLLPGYPLILQAVVVELQAVEVAELAKTAGQ